MDKMKTLWIKYILSFFPILFLAEKSIQKQLFQFYKELFTLRFTPQKPRINVELHAFSSPFHYDLERTPFHLPTSSVQN